jgi:Protein of unknown function (DUF1580)
MTQEELAKKILSEEVLTLSQAAHRLPAQRGAGKTDPATVWRWIDKGVNTYDGRKIHLEAVRVGGRWLTSAEALIRFVAAQTPTANDDPATVPTPRTPTQRKRAADRAAQQLDKIGI